MVTIETERLLLKLNSLADVQDSIRGLPAEQREMLSADWLAQLDASQTDDPWVVGFAIHQRNDGQVVGRCGFKGPPDGGGAVEIAYGIETEFQNRGFATETAAAMADWATQQPGVSVVRAHTLPESNASTRVLTKCGFEQVGDFMDPEDGLVWRWHKK